MKSTAGTEEAPGPGTMWVTSTTYSFAPMLL